MSHVLSVDYIACYITLMSMIRIDQDSDPTETESIPVLHRCGHCWVQLFAKTIRSMLYIIL